MADVNRTIDRSIRISRSVADLLPRRMRAAGERYADRVRAAPTRRARRRTRRRRRRSSSRGNGPNTRSTLRNGRCCTGIRCAGAATSGSSTRPPASRRSWTTGTSSSPTRARYDRPANYALVRIIPPRGVEVDDTKRPFVIVDPRAGHGPGIGGFKEDSEVGVALRAGHAGVLRHLLSRADAPSRRSPTSRMPRPSSSASSPSAIRKARSRSSSAIARAAGR